MGWQRSTAQMESFVRRVNSSIYGVLCAVSFASNRNLGKHARTPLALDFVLSLGEKKKKCCFYREPFFVSAYWAQQWRRLHRMRQVAWLVFTSSFSQIVKNSRKRIHLKERTEVWRRKEEATTCFLFALSIFTGSGCRSASHRQNGKNWNATSAASTILLLTCQQKRKSFRFVVFVFLSVCSRAVRSFFSLGL